VQTPPPTTIKRRRLCGEPILLAQNSWAALGSPADAVGADRTAQGCTGEMAGFFFNKLYIETPIAETRAAPGRKSLFRNPDFHSLYFLENRASCDASTKLEIEKGCEKRILLVATQTLRREDATAHAPRWTERPGGGP